MSDKIDITARCPIRTTLEMLGGKWKMLIIFQISQGVNRFGELKRSIPDISEKMLSQELKNLVDNRLITRKNFGEVPPRVEYQITDVGKKVLPLIEKIASFGQQYMSEMT